MATLPPFCNHFLLKAGLETGESPPLSEQFTRGCMFEEFPFPFYRVKVTLGYQDNWKITKAGRISLLSCKPSDPVSPWLDDDERLCQLSFSIGLQYSFQLAVNGVLCRGGAFAGKDPPRPVPSQTQGFQSLCRGSKMRFCSWAIRKSSSSPDCERPICATGRTSCPKSRRKRTVDAYTS